MNIRPLVSWVHVPNTPDPLLKHFDVYVRVLYFLCSALVFHSFAPLFYRCIMITGLYFPGSCTGTTSASFQLCHSFSQTHITLTNDHHKANLSFSWCWLFGFLEKNETSCFQCKMKKKNKMGKNENIIKVINESKLSETSQNQQQFKVFTYSLRPLYGPFWLHFHVLNMKFAYLKGVSCISYAEICVA